MNIRVEGLLPLIKVVNDKMEKKINNQLKSCDITFSQIRIIALLNASCKENYSMKELEKTFHVSQQTLAGIIKRLEYKKMVVSFWDAKDKRMKRIRLTENGREMGAKACDIMRQIEKEFETALDLEEVIMLKKILFKVCENIG